MVSVINDNILCIFQPNEEIAITKTKCVEFVAESVLIHWKTELDFQIEFFPQHNLP